MTELIEGPHRARSTLGGSPFPPVADYGFLSDCEVSALVAPSGNVEWMCLPRMDGPSVFAAMLDRGAGRFRLGPAEALVPSGRRYLPGTMVLETTWGYADWLGGGPRRPARGTVAARVGQIGDTPAGAGRSQRRARAAAYGQVPAGDG
jgi:GH15 family glucan-1,4-alpha-glucosidase